ncbi:MAG: Gas vesicle protein [Pedobacter sp.]|jgi:gas vesicle protein|nr:Gas vesicle protein [Pedobacter sp.]
MRFSKENSALTTIGLLSGLAVGAVVAALFAPKSGSEFREDIAKGIKGIIGQGAKNKSVEIKPNAVEDLRLHSKEVAEQLSAAPLEGLDTSKTTLHHDFPKTRPLPA